MTDKLRMYPDDGGLKEQKWTLEQVRQHFDPFQMLRDHFAPKKQIELPL